MKKLFASLFGALLILSSLNLKADEGMWLPMFLKKLNYDKMESLGCKLSPEQIYSINHSSLKDAIIQFGNGCTGEIISDQGLILTNHHCGYGQVQSHSSEEHDYLKNGFWAMSKAEELPNDDLTVSFLVRIEDVTVQINSELNDEMSEEDRDAKIQEAAEKLLNKATEDNHYEAQIKSYFEGNEFYLLVYEVFEDVRLVGTPPNTIGKFGADTDNWMWPRHKGDFCLFRVYADKDGKPAKYSKDNVPLKPKHHLPVSMGGVKEGDYAMIMGYPGSTDRYLSSYGVEMLQDITAPTVVKIREKKLQLMKEGMDSDNKIFIQYTSKYARTSNYWKYYIGQEKQLKQNKVYDKKLALEKKFAAWVSEDVKRTQKYGAVLPMLDKSYDQLSRFEAYNQYFDEAIWGGAEIFSLPRLIADYRDDVAEEGADKAALRADLEKELTNHFKDYHLATDKKIFAAMMQMYFEAINPDFHTKLFAKLVKKSKGDFDKMADYVYAKSKLSTPEKIVVYLEQPEKIGKDLASQLLDEFIGFYLAVDSHLQEYIAMRDKAERLFVAGLREMQPDKKFYPDANFTMRLTYGTVGGYHSRDAVSYDYYTTVEGIMEKEIPGDWEFDVPTKLKELYEQKDYGIYGENDSTMWVNFTTNNDITGGNSGSPVINGEGELIGLAFDGNWEAMSGDINFEPELQKTICVDIRYVLFIIDKYAGAGHLVKEMTLVDLEK